MASKIYLSNFEIADSDFKNVTWTGKTKSGQSLQIILPNAINKGNIEWTLAEKNEVVPTIEFEACYSNTDGMPEATDAPAWQIIFEDGATPPAGTILLGLGVFAIGGKEIALCRGGGSFKIEREFRDIVADGDRGSVKGRVVLDGERAKLSMNALTMLASFTDLYPAIRDGSQTT